MSSIYNVYILYSSKGDLFYIGHTSDMEDRMERHNTGKEKYTSKYLPWELIWCGTKENEN